MQDRTRGSADVARLKRPAIDLRAEPLEPAPPVRSASRHKIWEIQGGLQCSIVGTCLSHEDLIGIGRKAGDQLKPRTLFADIIENVADQHAIILNRTREASMLLPGKSLLVYELEPAQFATVAANEAEKAAPGITLVDLQMIGASGRLFIAGSTRECELARDRIDEVLGAIEGRQTGR